MAEFRMPALGADMESAILVEWLVKPGERVRRGQVVAVVETQKGAVEVEIWEDGVVRALRVEPGTRVPVGEVLATVDGEAAAVAPAAGPAVLGRPTTPPPAGPIPPPLAAAPEVRVKASPAARRHAEELGVDLSRVTPSGPHGTVSLEDIQRAALALKEKKPWPGPAPVDKPAAMRQAIGAAMAKSKREIPHYYLGTTIDVSRSLDWLAQRNAQRSVEERILFAAVLLKTVASALREVPELNGWWVDGAFKASDRVHLGVGIALRGGGLIAPAIHDADQQSVAELMARLGELIQRARSGAVRSSELTDASVTVTNLGEQGVETVYGVIYPPQVALIGFGKVVERPWADNGGVCVRRVVHATLSADHRASVGHRAALFLATLDRVLQEPESF